MTRIHVTGPARDDVQRILRRSNADFGGQARDRYRRLIDQAIQDLAEDPGRLGVLPIDDIREGYRLYHLKWSRKGSARAPVRQPRHFIAFYIDRSGAVIVARLFHERQMIGRYLRDNDHP